MIDLRLSEFLEACDNNCAASFHFINMVIANNDLTDEEFEIVQQVKDETEEISNMIADFTEGTIEHTHENFHRLKEMIQKIDPERLLPFLR